MFLDQAAFGVSLQRDKSARNVWRLLYVDRGKTYLAALVATYPRPLMPSGLGQEVSHTRCSRTVTLDAPHLNVRKLADDDFRA